MTGYTNMVNELLKMDKTMLNLIRISLRNTENQRFISIYNPTSLHK